MYSTDVTTLGHSTFHLSPGSCLSQNSYHTSAVSSLGRVRLSQGRTEMDYGQVELTLKLRGITTSWIQHHPVTHTDCSKRTGLCYPLKEVSIYCWVGHIEVAHRFIQRFKIKWQVWGKDRMYFLSYLSCHQGWVHYVPNMESYSCHPMKTLGSGKDWPCQNHVPFFYMFIK